MRRSFSLKTVSVIQLSCAYTLKRLVVSLHHVQFTITIELLSKEKEESNKMTGKLNLEFEKKKCLIILEPLLLFGTIINQLPNGPIHIMHKVNENIENRGPD
ncbi:hypothetical protein ACJX0J_036006 [Zea mays]